MQWEGACMRPQKLVSLSEAIGNIPNGASVAVGTKREPMALIYELLRQRKPLDTLYELRCGFSAELLAGAGLIRQLCVPQLMFPGGEVPPRLTFMAERQALAVQKIPLECLAEQLRAGCDGRPFAVADLPDALLSAYPQTFRSVPQPFAGGSVTVAAALNPDVALIHAHCADRFGNVLLDPLPCADRNQDILPAKAARMVIVSAEQIVSEETVQKNDRYTLLTADQVDYVAEAPYGCYPREYEKRYLADQGHLSTYLGQAQTPEGFSDYMRTCLQSGGDWYGFLESAGLQRLFALTVNRRGASF